MSSFQYVVLGGGNASGYAAHRFVRNGLTPGQLCIITDEPVSLSVCSARLSFMYWISMLPMRDQLSAKPFCFLISRLGCPDSTHVSEWDWNVKMLSGTQQKVQDNITWRVDVHELILLSGIEYKTGTKVTEVDVVEKNLTTDKGDSVAYGKLIVATGARPVYLSDFKVPGAELEGIYYLRNIVDGERLIHAMANAKQAGNKVIFDPCLCMSKSIHTGCCRGRWLHWDGMHSCIVQEWFGGDNGVS